jgi:hypothetical protein
MVINNHNKTESDQLARFACPKRVNIILEKEIPKEAVIRVNHLTHKSGKRKKPTETMSIEAMAQIMEMTYTI